MSESCNLLVDVVRGKYLGILDFSTPVVDVRDVSHAHLAVLRSDTAHGRYILAAREDSVSIQELSDAARSAGYDPPSRDLTAPMWTRLIKSASLAVPGQSGHYMRAFLGVHYRFSSARARNELGMSFVPVEQSVHDTLDDLARRGHIETPQKRP